MKKLLIVSTIVLGTFASAGIASAADASFGSYTGWQHDVFADSRQS